MLTYEAARKRAHDWLTAGAPVGIEVSANIYQFDLGWLVWGTYTQAATGTPADIVNSAVAVIDAETGVITTYPAGIGSDIVASYRHLKHGEPENPHPITSVVVAA